MVKLTRNSYKRKIILFGVLIFASIALISTGFAAWVMSANASADKDGNVTVGVVSDNNLKIENVDLVNGTFLFEPKEADTTGRVRNDGVNFESLEATLTAKVSPTKYITSLVVKLEIPASVYKASTDSYKYIILPEGFENWTASEDGKTYTGTKTISVTEVKASSSYNLSQVVKFEWGDAFDNVNPGEYFDREEIVNSINDATVKKTLEDFRAVVYGYDTELNVAGNDQAKRDEEISKHNTALSYKLIIEAKC